MDDLYCTDLPTVSSVVLDVQIRSKMYDGAYVDLPHFRLEIMDIGSNVLVLYIK